MEQAGKGISRAGLIWFGKFRPISEGRRRATTASTSITSKRHLQGRLESPFCITGSAVAGSMGPFRTRLRLLLSAKVRGTVLLPLKDASYTADSERRVNLVMSWRCAYAMMRAQRARRPSKDGQGWDKQCKGTLAASRTLARSPRARHQSLKPHFHQERAPSAAPRSSGHELSRAVKI